MISGHGASEELSKYTDPMFLPSRGEMPKTAADIYKFCRFLYHSNQQLRSGVRHLVSHGVTKLQFRGDVGSIEERDRFEKFYGEKINAYEQLNLLGQEFIVYGCAYLRIHFPFIRRLIDDRGKGGYYTLSMFPRGQIKFDIRSMTYEVPDPIDSDTPVEKRKRVKLRFDDKVSRDYSKIRLARLNPEYVKLVHSSWSKDTRVQYSFTPKLRESIRRGDIHEVNNAPADVIKAVRDRKDYLFDPDAVFILTNETISGFNEDGAGLPETMVSFSTLYKMAVYDRLDETVSNEMMLPYRVVSPALSGNETDVAAFGATFRKEVARMHSAQQKDRTKIHSFGVPINYQELGGQGKAQSPKELKDYEQRNLLLGLGIPPELHDGSLQMANTPYAIRVFESTHRNLFQGLSRAANFSVRKISRFMNKVAFDAILKPSSVADDLDRKNMISSLYSSQELPRRVLYETLNLDDSIDLREERAKEDLEIQERLAKLEEEQKQKMEMGSLDRALDKGSGGEERGGTPTGAGGKQNATPTDVRSNAEMLAQEWLGYPTDGQRAKAMQQVEAQDPVLYAVAKDIMDQMRRDGASQGRQMINQQAQQEMQQGAGQPV